MWLVSTVLSLDNPLHVATYFNENMKKAEVLNVGGYDLNNFST
jgi:hypothetical protein